MKKKVLVTKKFCWGRVKGGPLEVIPTLLLIQNRRSNQHQGFRECADLGESRGFLIGELEDVVEREKGRTHLEGKA